jgi:glycosyltransferase involved in cell wall biosynthesis
MHIGIDARLPFFRRGGISEYTVNLIAALATLDVTDRFSIVHAKDDRTSYVPPGASQMRRVDALTPAHHPRERLLLASEIARLEIDVFHSPDFIPPASGAAHRVVTVPDLAFLDHPDHVTADSYRHYAGQIEWAVRSADAIATCSEHTRRDVIARWHVAPDKIVAIPLAAAPCYAQPPEDAQVRRVLQRLALRPGFILCVGTIEPRKNLGTLLSAYQILQQEHATSAPLVLVGATGWRCADVLEAIRTHPRDIRHVRDASAHDLGCLYAAAGVLALPSIHEGFGLPMVEAMQCGCPVVSSTGGALPETAAGAAVLVDPMDVRGWASALAQVLTNADLREEVRRKGIVRASQLSWRATAAGTLDLYREAAA